MTPKIFTPSTSATLRVNATSEELLRESLARGEGRLASTGALAVETGTHTGRSAQDKFIVRDSETEDTVWWDNAKAMTPAQFDTLYADFVAHSEGRELFVQDLWGGADEDHRLNVRVFCEYAWHALFIRYLLRRPQAADLADFATEFTVVDLPSFRADPERHGVRDETVIACDLTRRIFLIGGTSYAGEMKKSVFSFLNYLLPTRGVMPMHCSANVGPNGSSAVFFGLSGTGKTTLSNDPARPLIGDDEHGWSENGIFNFEGGCYAKTIDLSQAAEPLIWKATNSPGTILENVVVTADGTPDFADVSLTPNTRSAYPMHVVENASETATAGHPTSIVMLCADAFGVLPPIARLTPSQAMYHFLSGYTAKVAGTEKDMGNEPEATFSTCFGAPFMARHPSEYGNLLRRLISEHDVDCWLVNTGWTGGPYGVGSRMPIRATRRLLSAALNGELADVAMREDTTFGFDVPVSVDDVDDAMLDPRSTWSDPHAYDAQAARLVKMFSDNFARFTQHVDADVRSAGPSLQQAAE